VHEHAKGTVLYDGEQVVAAHRLRSLATTLGSAHADQTATLVPFFGPTIGGEHTVVDGLGMDLSRTLLGSVSYEWHRPFVAEEAVHVRVGVDDVYAKGSNQFGVVVAEFRDGHGELIQRQSTTFVERKSS
jgi:hypothetical protein